MVIKSIVVRVPRGLKPAINAAIFVQKILSLNSEVIIIKDGKFIHVDKDITIGIALAVQIMDLGIVKDDEITLIISGLNEQDALTDLEEFLLVEESKDFAQLFVK